jgi:PIN domain nuclease of toxin-antitoxin system
MKLLLDTHAMIWAFAEPNKLQPKARAAIEDTRNEVWVSSATTWEITIKHALGKMPLPTSPEVYLPARIAHYGFKELSISVAHTLALARLPTHHSDPFDRILIAQAQVEGLTLVSSNPQIAKYRVHLLAK